MKKSNRSRLSGAAALLLFLGLTSCSSHATSSTEADKSTTANPEPELTLPVAASPSCGFPARSTTGFSTAKFLSTYASPSTAREIAVIKEVLQGNIPDHLRQFETIEVLGRWKGDAVVFEMDVAPDYLMIGDDQDSVRMPITNSAAQVIASQLGLYLPTSQLVDTIYHSAATQLAPQPTDWYKSDTKMRWGPNYEVFNSTIEKQRGPRGGLVAGHKKDVVVTHLLNQNPTRVAIYGWHQTNGKPIQPLAVPHDMTYEDYSHGIRFLGPYLRIRHGAALIATISMHDAYLDTEIGPQLNSGSRLSDARAAHSCSADLAKALGLKQADCPPAPRVCP